MRKQIKKEDLCSMCNGTGHTLAGAGCMDCFYTGIKPETKDKYVNTKEEIDIKGFWINCIGDEESGIRSENYELKSDLYFPNEDELMQFKQELADLFVNYTGGNHNIKIFTFEELDETGDILTKLRKSGGNR